MSHLKNHDSGNTIQFSFLTIVFPTYVPWKSQYQNISFFSENQETFLTVYKNRVLKNFVKLTEKHMCLSLIFIIVIKKTRAQVFSYEFCDISRTPLHLQAAASIVIIWNTKLLSFSFLLLIFSMFIYWSFSPLDLSYLSYLSRRTIIKIYSDSYTICTCACHWISHYLVSFFESMSRHKREKKGEKTRKLL